jgi:hypothetical protein
MNRHGKSSINLPNNFRIYSINNYYDMHNLANEIFVSLDVDMFSLDPNGFLPFFMI